MCMGVFLFVLGHTTIIFFKTGDDRQVVFVQLPLFGKLIPNRIENLLLHGKGGEELNTICIFCRVVTNIL